MRSIKHTALLREGVGVCGFGGVFLLIWAAASQSRLVLGFAVAIWVVGAVLSFGIPSDATPDEVTGGDAEESWQASRPGTAGSPEATASPGTQTSGEALEELRERYARGEVTEMGFERRVERLLDTEAVGADDDSLQTLRERYARGELSDEQFDRKLDRLTETRSLEDVADTYERETSTED